MTEERYKELDSDFDKKLTQAELALGWHFCPESDGRLVGPGTPALEHCVCKQVKR